LRADGQQAAVAAGMPVCRGRLIPLLFLLADQLMIGVEHRRDLVIHVTAYE
jgi:hypothetical protein